MRLPIDLPPELEQRLREQAAHEGLEPAEYARRLIEQVLAEDVLHTPEEEPTLRSVVITGLFRYPVKSCAGYAVTEAELDRYGMVGDRRWMVTDSSGKFLTQREVPRMALISPRETDDGLTLSRPDAPPLHVPWNVEGAPTVVRVWRDTCAARDQGEAAAAWLSEYLERDCRLAGMGAEFERQVDLTYADPGEEVGFADGFPLLLTTEESLADLNGRLATPIPMDRFRPNVVVRGAAAAWAEDRWRTLTSVRTGTLLRVVKPCARCRIPTIDQETGLSTGNEPLATLSKYRLINGNVMFGQNLIHQWSGEPITLRVGDELVVEE